MEAIYHIWPFFTHTHTPLLNFRTKFVPAGLSVAGIEPPPPQFGAGDICLSHMPSIILTATGARQWKAGNYLLH